MLTSNNWNNQLQDINNRIINCSKCPRLTKYRKMVSISKRLMYRDQPYWGKPVPSFGDEQAQTLIVGLAPAAHGGNRTGRMFTGDKSGDWLYGALYRNGFANHPDSQGIHDGLTIQDIYITAAVHCAPPDNRPNKEEFEACGHYLVEELLSLKNLSVVLALGKIAFESYLTAIKTLGVNLPSPKPKFGHGVQFQIANGIRLFGSYHPSQRNTQTGRLTQPMFDSIFRTIRKELGVGKAPGF